MKTARSACQLNLQLRGNRGTADAHAAIVSKHWKTRFRRANRWAGRVIAALDRPTLIYDLLVSIASRVAPPGNTRRRLARKMQCSAALVPDLIVCYTAIHGLIGLIILLCLRGLIVIFGI